MVRKPWPQASCPAGQGSSPSPPPCLICKGGLSARERVRVQLQGVGTGCAARPPAPRGGLRAVVQPRCLSRGLAFFTCPGPVRSVGGMAWSPVVGSQDSRMASSAAWCRRSGPKQEREASPSPSLWPLPSKASLGVQGPFWRSKQSLAPVSGCTGNMAMGPAADVLSRQPASESISRHQLKKGGVCPPGTAAGWAGLGTALEALGAAGRDSVRSCALQQFKELGAWEPGRRGRQGQG